MVLVPSFPVWPGSKALVLCTGLYMVLGPCAMCWSIHGPENGITSVYGQWNAILVMYTCGSSGVLPPALSMLCQQNPTMYQAILGSTIRST